MRVCMCGYSGNKFEEVCPLCASELLDITNIKDLAQNWGLVK